MKPLRVVILNADPATSNMGVSALFATAVSGVARRMPEAEICVVDSRLGVRKESVLVDDGDPIPITIVGARTGRRFHRPENLWTMLVARRLGPIGRFFSPTLKALLEADIVLDVSGGDSFTNLYGSVRWYWTVLAKRITLGAGVPLLMLPKTYGPFGDRREEASSMVKGSIACWARDKRSFEILKDLLGGEFDPERHRVGVDMAFGLSPREPKLVPDLFKSRDDTESARVLVGLNVSGLMYNDPEAAKSQYGFVADYSRVIDGFIDWLLRETESDLVLVPHVMAPPPSKESDVYACENVMERISDRVSGRVLITPTDFGPNEVKWIISKCDWFCGTRMHATIAGLSTGTPTATVSYSDKALGVFESCGQGREVFDPRKMKTDDVVESMIDSYRRRSEIRESLEANIPGVKAIAEKQMDDICEVIRECGDERRSRRSV